MADKYALNIVVKRCEEFLIKRATMSEMEKLAFAHQYNLNKLKVFEYTKCPRIFNIQKNDMGK